MDYKDLDKFVDGYNPKETKEEKDTTGDVFDILEDYKNPVKKGKILTEGSYEKTQLDSLGRPKGEDKYSIQIRLDRKKTNYMLISQESFEKIKQIIIKDN